MGQTDTVRHLGYCYRDEYREAKYVSPGNTVLPDSTVMDPHCLELRDVTSASFLSPLVTITWGRSPFFFWPASLKLCGFSF